jgi:hypothetical protein
MLITWHLYQVMTGGDEDAREEQNADRETGRRLLEE